MTAPHPSASLTPPFEPPYYAVIFTSLRTPEDAGYGEAASLMAEMAARQPGYLGVDSARDPATGLGITISYWRDEDSIANWRRNAEHAVVQKTGRKLWYEAFVTHVAKVERSYGFRRAADDAAAPVSVQE